MRGTDVVEAMEAAERAAATKQPAPRSRPNSTELATLYGRLKQQIDAVHTKLEVRERVRRLQASPASLTTGVPASPAGAKPAEGVAALQAVPGTVREASALTARNGVSSLSYYGSAMVSGDFDGDGAADLAVGAYGEGDRATAPRSGAVWVYPGGSFADDAKAPSAHLTIGGELALSAIARFGETLAVLDFNDDGIDDLVVGAPSYSGWSIADPRCPAADRTRDCARRGGRELAAASPRRLLQRLLMVLAR